MYYCHVNIQIICVSITQIMSFSRMIQLQIKCWFKLPYLFILLWCVVLSSSSSLNHQSDIAEEADHVCFRMPLNVSTPCLSSCLFDFLLECYTAFILLHPLSQYMMPFVLLLRRLATCLQECLPEFPIRA